MSERGDMLMALYRAFNDRDLEGALEHMAPGVDWPNGMTGGREIGRDAVRRYWTKQWAEIDPTVEPLEIVEEGTRARVRVDQLVRSLDGEVLQNRQVEHVYEFDGPFIARMTIIELPDQPDDEEDD